VAYENVTGFARFKHGVPILARAASDRLDEIATICLSGCKLAAARWEKDWRTPLARGGHLFPSSNPFAGTRPKRHALESLLRPLSRPIGRMVGLAAVELVRPSRPRDKLHCATRRGIPDTRPQWSRSRNCLYFAVRDGLSYIARSLNHFIDGLEAVSPIFPPTSIHCLHPSNGRLRIVPRQEAKRKGRPESSRRAASLE